jgi:uncharacterized protein
MASKKIIVFIIAAALALAAGGYYVFTKTKTATDKNSTAAAAPVVKKDSSVFDPLIPAAIGYVNDFGYYFTPKQSDTLTSIIQQFEKATTDQIAIVTFNTLPVTNENFDAFTKALFNKWGVGVKGKNNGIVIAICKSMRKIRIQNGDGITPKLSDETTKAIIDEVIIPEFKKGDYYAGVKKGLLTIIARLN